MGDIIRYITRPDASVDDRYLKVVSERERERRLRLLEEKKEERRRVGILKKIFPDAKYIRGVKFISVYDLAGYYLETFKTLNECADELDVLLSQICSVLHAVGREKGPRQARGYQFRKAKWMDDWDGGHWDTRRIKPYTGKYRMKYIHKEYKRRTLNQ